MLFLRYFILSFILFAFSSSAADAQVITILSETNKEPLENIALFNPKLSNATLTDKYGKANITNFNENDSITFQHPSYNTVVFLKSDLEKTRTVYLARRVFLIDEFVISASKFEEKKNDVPNMIDVIPEEKIRQAAAQNAVDILSITGNLAIQKTQGGGGSPIIRGFEANKILLVIDGVRMNNAIYRSGHLQNALSIDNSILDRVEVIFGPTSLIYGSDALGGVIHYYTSEPELAGADQKTNFKLQAHSQFSSANKGKASHLDFNFGGKHIASLSSVSYKELRDIRMGGNVNTVYGDYGRITHFVKRINGADSTVLNPDPFLQKNTGYSQLDILQKFKYSPSKYFDWILNLQYSTTSEIDRLDYLNDYSKDGFNLDYARYYYGPQNRLFASLKSVVKKDRLLFSNFTSTLAYQKIDEDRYSRKFRRNDLLSQKEDVHVFTFNQDYLKILPRKQRVNYGLELTYNRVQSNAFYQDIIDNSVNPAPTRYPDGGTNAWSAAGYASYKWTPGEKFLFSGGLRYQFGFYHSSFTNGFLPYEEITIKNPAITWSMSMICHPGSNWQINVISSSGFRNPNVDDYGKVRAKDGEVTVPNPGLKPEYSYNFEIGISKRIKGLLKINTSAYYTLLEDAIVRTPYSLNGSDILIYDGDPYQVITNSNASRAFISGLSFAVVSDFSQNLVLKSTYNLTKGRDKSLNEPLAHIPPAFGKTSMLYRYKKLSAEIFFDYNAWKKISDLSPLGEDNESEGTVDGFPSWYTFNLHTNYHFSEAIEFQFALENIFDELYKTFASGVAAPGRNFIFTLRMRI